MSENALPTGWAHTTLGELFEFRGGGTPDKTQPHYWNGNMPWASVKDIKGNQLDRTKDTITQNGLENSASSIAEIEDVILVTRISPGETVVSKIRCSINQDLKIVRPPSGMGANFIHLLFKKLQPNIVSLSSGTTVLGIRLNELRSVQFPLPPLPEQKRIVAKIEELFSELDSGEENLRLARRQLGIYRQSLLKQAFEGKLTEKWRAQNSGQLESPATLLSRIQSARQSHYKKHLEEWKAYLGKWEKNGSDGKRPAKPRNPKSIEFPSTDQVVDLPKLPTEWSWIAVASCAVEISDGPFGSNLKSSDYKGAGVRVIRLGNIGPGVFVDEDQSFISSEKYEKLRRHTVRPGDIVVASFINDAVRATLIPPSIEYAVNKADCFQVKCFGKTTSADFLVRCFGARYFFKQLEQLVHGVGRPRINTAQLGEAFIPLCSSAEQREIVRLLDEQLQVIERNERAIEAALRKSEALRQSILKKAFSGRLVPQDPHDEPASKLLDRIREEKKLGAKNPKPFHPKALSHAS